MLREKNPPGNCPASRPKNASRTQPSHAAGGVEGDAARDLALLDACAPTWIRRMKINPTYTLIYFNAKG